LYNYTNPSHLGTMRQRARAAGAAITRAQHYLQST
jgi:hypothetical protein